MNQHTASETAAALELQAHAALLVAGYAKPEDAEASRLGVLMAAAQLESKDQSTNEAVVLVSLDALAAIHKFVTTGREDRLCEELAGILESINYEGSGK